MVRINNRKSGPVNDVLTQFGIVPSEQKQNQINKSEQSYSGVLDNVTCENMPFIRFNYMDYGIKQEKIVVLIDLPGGSGTYDWEFNDNGDAVFVSADWSKALYDVANLFKTDLLTRKISMDHPKIYSMQSELLRKGISPKQVPRCCITVPLGKRVQKDDGTWEVSVITHDGNKILMIEFTGFQVEVLKQVKRGSFK